MCEVFCVVLLCCLRLLLSVLFVFVLFCLLRQPNVYGVCSHLRHFHCMCYGYYGCKCLLLFPSLFRLCVAFGLCVASMRVRALIVRLFICLSVCIVVSLFLF